MSTTTRAYGFGTRVALLYDQAIARTRIALKEQGIGVLTEIAHATDATADHHAASRARRMTGWRRGAGNHLAR
jgi:uncharacterized protein (DUF302 family)